MNHLFEYAKSLVEKSPKLFVSGEVFAKVLTQNDDSSSIHLYWLTSDSGNVTEVNFTTLDNNGNGLIDAVQWVVPHLSNQTFEVGIDVLDHCREGRGFAAAG